MGSEGAGGESGQLTDRMRAHGDALNMVRGTVMTCYAQVEFQLADLAVRASHLKCYDGVVPRYPRRLEERIKGIRQLVDAAGPLNQFRDELHSGVDEIRRFTDLRDLMGHATAHIDFSPTEHLVHFEMYDVVKGGKLQLVIHNATIEVLRTEAEKLVAYTSKMMRLFRRMRGVLPVRKGGRGSDPRSLVLCSREASVIKAIRPSASA